MPVLRSFPSNGPIFAHVKVDRTYQSMGSNPDFKLSCLYILQYHQIDLYG